MTSRANVATSTLTATLWTLGFLPPGANWTLISAKSDDFTGDSLNTNNWGTTHWNPASRGEPYFTYDATQHPAVATQLQPLILYIRGLAQPPVDSALPADTLVDYVHVYTAS